MDEERNWGRRGKMAAHLSYGRVNLNVLREAVRRELREFLDKCAGSKVRGGRWPRRPEARSGLASSGPTVGSGSRWLRYLELPRRRAGGPDSAWRRAVLWQQRPPPCGLGPRDQLPSGALQTARGRGDDAPRYRDHRCRNDSDVGKSLEHQRRIPRCSRDGERSCRLRFSPDRPVSTRFTVEAETVGQDSRLMPLPLPREPIRSPPPAPGGKTLTGKGERRELRVPS